jgi:hypothetical protein
LNSILAFEPFLQVVFVENAENVEYYDVPFLKGNERPVGAMIPIVQDVVLFMKGA